MAKGFQKGNKLSPGRPKNTNYTAMLDDVIRTAHKKHNKHILQHFIDLAYIDTQACIAVVKKLLPDLKAVDMKLDGSSPFKLVIDMTPTSNTTKTNKKDINNIDYE